MYRPVNVGSGGAMSAASQLYLNPKELSLALGVIVVALLIAFQRSAHLPSPQPLSIPATQFSEERARVHLHELLSLGTQRTVGSEANEVKAPEMILREVERVQKQVGPRVKFETDRQYGSGSFSLDFLEGFTSVYENVQNVLVMLHGTEHPPEHGVLMLSAHYDSPVGTRGASDNAANVANLLEILRNLAHDPPKRSCLFMFTGAEETILQGSHMFARSNHKWVPYVKAFMNLEAAGTGGRELMFQATDARLAMAWAKASPYPHGSIVGQEVFQSGIIPSDTDFRMYVAELGIPGMDMANVDNGHNYHTILDNVNNVQVGAMQRYGSNVLATAKQILQDEDDSFWARDYSNKGKTEKQNPELFVFFDVLGFFVVVFPPLLTYLLILLGALVLVSYFRIVFSQRTDETEKDARNNALLRMVKLFGRSLFQPLFTAVIVHWFVPLAYYARPWLVVPLYIAPALSGIVSTMSTAQTEPERPNIRKAPLVRRELLSFTFSISFWMVLAIILILKGKGSFYLAYLWSVIPCLVRLVHALGWKDTLATAFQTLSPESARQKLMAIESKKTALIGTVYGVFLPLLLTLPLLLVVIRFFVPITGRSGSRVPGDVIVAVVCGLCTFLLCLVPCTVLTLAPYPVLMLTRKALRYLWVAGLVMVLLLRIFYGPGASSFSETNAKRIYAIHVDAHSAITAQEESFVWIIDADSSTSSSVLSATHQTDPFFSLDRDMEMINCNEKPHSSKVYCGMPYFLPLKSEISKTVKIKAKPSPLAETKGKECLLTKKKEEVIDDSTRRIHFCFKANERGNIFFRDAAHGGPKRWSLDAPLAPTLGHLYLLVANGKPTQNGNCFWVDVPKQDKLDVAWACYYVEDQLPMELSKFLAALPSWTTPVSFIASWKDGQF